MAKYSNLNILSNIKLNGAIYTETSSSKAAIKYDEVSGSWVYQNAQTDEWLKFSASTLDIIKDLTALSSANNDSVPNCKVMTDYINGQFDLHTEDENQTISGIYENISAVVDELNAIKIVSTQATNGNLATYQLQGLSGEPLGVNIDIPKTISDAADIKYNQTNVSAELETISANLNNKINTTQIIDVLDNNNKDESNMIPSNKAVSDFVANAIAGFGTNTEIEGLRTDLNTVSGNLNIVSGNLNTLSTVITEFPVIEKTIEEISSEFKGNASGFYYAETGEACIWDGTETVQLSYELIDEISEQNQQNTEQIPSIKAVSNFVSEQLKNNIPEGTTYTSGDGITIQGNEISVKLDNTEYNGITKSNNGLFAPSIDTVGAGIGVSINENQQYVINIRTATEDPYLEITSSYTIGTKSQLKTDIDNKLSWQKVDSYQEQAHTQKNTLYITDENSCYLSGHQISMPVVDNIIDDVKTDEYIPSVKAICDYVANETKSITNTEAAAELIVYDIQYAVNADNYSWNENELVIKHDLNCQLPTVLIFIADKNENIIGRKYQCMQLPWNIKFGDQTYVYIDCSGYTDKLITVKITK